MSRRSASNLTEKNSGEFDDILHHLLRHTKNENERARAHQRQEHKDQRRHQVSSDVNRVLRGQSSQITLGGAENNAGGGAAALPRLHQQPHQRHLGQQDLLRRQQYEQQFQTHRGRVSSGNLRRNQNADGSGVLPSAWGRVQEAMLPENYQARRTRNPLGGEGKRRINNVDDRDNAGRAANIGVSLSQLIDELRTPEQERQRLEEVGDDLLLGPPGPSQPNANIPSGIFSDPGSVDDFRAPAQQRQEQQRQQQQQRDPSQRRSDDGDEQHQGYGDDDDDLLLGPNPRGNSNDNNDNNGGRLVAHASQQHDEVEQGEEMRVRNDDDDDPDEEQQPGLEEDESGIFIEHEVHKFGSFDLIKHGEKVEGQRKLQDRKIARMELFGHTLQLFSAITTIMIIGSNIRARTSEATRRAVGGAMVDILTNTLAYGPLPFFALLILRVNNHFAARLYYKYLQRGGIIDFPQSDHFMWFKRPEPVLFILYFAVYFVVATVVIIVVEAPTSDALLFYNNIIAGVALFWFRQQSIEPYFISLTNYIESFKDSHERYHNIDATSLFSAASQVLRVKLFDANHPSYRGEMRDAFFKYKNFSPKRRIAVVGAVYGTVALFMLCGIMYVIFMGRMRQEGYWENTINPCVEACILTDPQGTTWSTGASSPGVGFTLLRDPKRCNMCMCRCFRAMQMSLDELMGKCAGQFRVEGCTSDTTTCDLARCHGIHSMVATS